MVNENLVMRSLAGTQCPGCTWKKYLLRRPKLKDQAGRPTSYYFLKGALKSLMNKDCLKVMSGYCALKSVWLWK